jgi:hypothetical protein
MGICETLIRRLVVARRNALRNALFILKTRFRLFDWTLEFAEKRLVRRIEFWGHSISLHDENSGNYRSITLGDPDWLKQLIESVHRRAWHDTYKHPNFSERSQISFIPPDWVHNTPN